MLRYFQRFTAFQRMLCMKNVLLFLFLFLIAELSAAQEKSDNANKYFGIALNGNWRMQDVGMSSSLNGLYYSNGNQLNLGVGTKPFFLNGSRTIIGAQLGYKVFPNRLDNTVSSYFCSQLNYLADVSSASYSFRRHSLSLTFGYGFEIIVSHFFVGTDVGIGTVTESFGLNENPPLHSYPYPMFTNFSLDATLNFNVGYRF